MLLDQTVWPGTSWTKHTIPKTSMNAFGIRWTPARLSPSGTEDGSESPGITADRWHGLSMTQNITREITLKPPFLPWNESSGMSSKHTYNDNRLRRSKSRWSFRISQKWSLLYALFFSLKDSTEPLLKYSKWFDHTIVKKNPNYWRYNRIIWIH